MNKLRIIFMGTPEFGLKALENIHNTYEVIAVVCQPDRPSNRGVVKFSKIKEFAIEHNIKVFQPLKIREEYSDILALEPDMIVTCAYGQIIPKEILDYPKYGCINIHASLLPKLRGGAPIHRAIIEGHTESGITIMKMSLKMDAGDMISQESIPILETDTVGSLHDKLSDIAANLIIKTIPSIINGTATYTKQNEDEVTFGFVIKKEDEHVDFNKTTKEIINQIRGLNPFPGSYVNLEAKIVKLWSSRKGISNTNALCGEIIALYEDGIGVKTKDGEVVITELQFEGKKKMSSKDYLLGVVNKEDLIGKVFK